MEKTQLHEGHSWMLREIKAIVSEVFHIADGIVGDMGTEHWDKVTEDEATLARALVRIKQILEEYHIPTL